MRRDIEQEADVIARQRFRLFIVMYLVYPVVIFTLLAVIAIGGYAWYNGATILANNSSSAEPEWCSASYTTPTSYGLTRTDGYAPAIQPGSSYGLNPGLPDFFRVTRIGADQIAYYVSESIRAADGAPDARFRRDMMGLSPVQLGVARKRFIERSRMDGKLGYYRLGLVQLGDDAYPIAAKAGLKVPFCRPNNFVTVDKGEAFFNFAIAKACDSAGATRAGDWMWAIMTYEGMTNERTNAIEMDARNYVIADPGICLATMADTQPTSNTPGSSESGDNDPDLSPTPSERKAEAATDTSAGPPPEPHPDESTRRDERALARASRQALNLGDAALAGGDDKAAREFWLQAIDAGKIVGAQTALDAQKRLKTRTLTCNFTRRSLAAISRDYKALSGDLVHVKVIQQALKALGYYEGPITGNTGIITRAAIRKFQRDMEFDETDTLTPRQTVYLICNAAENANDLASQNSLGIMYAAGLGVEQNIDQALNWLRQASNRRYPNATYNLALLYGSGVVLSSYRLCDMPRSPEQADQYLREAAERGHARARQLWARYGNLDVRERWKKIEAEELAHNPADQNGVYENRLSEEKVVAKCKPGRDVR